MQKPTQDTKKVLNEAEDRIKNLIKQEKWVDAHRACLEILRFDSENLRIIRLKNKIEKGVKNENKKAIKEDMKMLKHLWEEKKYEELIEHFKELEPYINEYAPLKKMVKQVQKSYLAEYNKEQVNYHQAEKNRIDELIKNKEYQEAIRSAQKLRLLKINNTEVKKLIKRIKKEWITYELETNKNLFNSEKYEDILLKLQSIKKIHPESVQIRTLLNTKKKKYEQYKLEEKREYIFKGLEKTKTLIQLKKFEKALHAAKEILDVDPKNTKANYYLKIAKKKLAKSTDNEIRDQIKKSFRNMKKKIKDNKSKFIKI